MWIVGNKNTNEILNNGFASHNKTLTQSELDAFKARIKTKFAERNNLQEGDISAYWINYNLNPSSDHARILSGDEFTAVWSNNEIVGVDFTVEDTKGWIKFESNKNNIEGDGVDETIITLTVYESNKSTIKTSLSTVNPKLVPVQTPNGIIKAAMSVTNGVGQLVFKKINDLPLGRYVFPAKDKYLWGYRVWEYTEIDVYFNML